jgi:hypothetical protein
LYGRSLAQPEGRKEKRSGPPLLADQQGGQGAVVLGGGAVGVVVEEGPLAAGGLGGADGLADRKRVEEVGEAGGEPGEDLAGEEGVAVDAESSSALACERLRSPGRSGSQQVGLVEQV